MGKLWFKKRVISAMPLYYLMGTDTFMNKLINNKHVYF